MISHISYVNTFHDSCGISPLAYLLPEYVFDCLNYLSSAELLSYENGLTVRVKEGTNEGR